jgi:hypothetical protein
MLTSDALEGVDISKAIKADNTAARSLFVGWADAVSRVCVCVYACLRAVGLALHILMHFQKAYAFQHGRCQDVDACQSA